MDIQHLNTLQTDLKYLGFGEKTLLNDQLTEQVEKGLESFQLYTTGFFDDSKVEVTFYYTRSGSADRYYLKKYDALLCYPDEEERNRAQTISIYQGKGFTFKETFNLLQGRAVYKKLKNFDEEEYYAWSQLDFTEKTWQNNYRIREYRDSYGFDLEKALEILPIEELQKEDRKAELIRSLQRGNLREVTFIKKSRWEKVFIAANPKEKVIGIYYPQATRASHGKKSAETELPALPGPEILPPSSTEGEDDRDELFATEIEPAGMPAEIEGPATDKASHRAGRPTPRKKVNL